jgi:hypothetical protein
VVFVFLPAAAAAPTVEDCLEAAAAAEVTLEESIRSLVQDDPQRDVASLQGEVARLEAAGGKLEPRLVPELLALGIAYGAEERYLDAASAFQRAVFVIRAEDGLYSTRQIPIVSLLIDSRAAAGDWKGVADAYDLFAWIYRRSHAPLDPVQLPAIRELRHWYIGAYDKNTGRTLTELFAANERVTAQAVEIIRHCGGGQREALCFLDNACCPGTARWGAGCPAMPAPPANLRPSGESNPADFNGES